MYTAQLDVEPIFTLCKYVYGLALLPLILTPAYLHNYIGHSKVFRSIHNGNIKHKFALPKWLVGWFS